MHERKGPVSASWRRLLGDARGATALEYALIASLIAILVIGGAATIGGSTSNAFNAVSTPLAGEDG